MSDTAKGNGSLTYPADEIVTAGSSFYMSDNSSNNEKFYLYKGTWYWTLSPSNFNGSTSFVFYVYITGFMNNRAVHCVHAVAPVINLSPESSASLDGTGKMTDPFYLE